MSNYRHLYFELKSEVKKLVLMFPELVEGEEENFNIPAYVIEDLRKLLGLEKKDRFKRKS